MGGSRRSSPPVLMLSFCEYCSPRGTPPKAMLHILHLMCLAWNLKNALSYVPHSDRRIVSDKLAA